MDGAAARRLRRAVPLAAPAAATPTAAADAAPPPMLLSDEAMKQFAQDGYLALHVGELGQAFHDDMYRRICEGWDPDVTGEERNTRQVFPELPELSDVIGSPTLRGALTSLLGPAYGQHPHRTMHTRAAGSGDQAWHK